MVGIFDFSKISECEKTIQKTWNEFRRQIVEGYFLYNDIDKAAQSTFLRVLNDVFQHGHHFFDKTCGNIFSDDTSIVRAARIKPEDPLPDYSRFIPNAEFIKDDNRFSPAGMEWLYLAFAPQNSKMGLQIAEECALKECRATTGETFALCNFQIDEKYNKNLLIDLTIAKEYNYDDINARLVQCEQEIEHREHDIYDFIALVSGVLPQSRVDDINSSVVEWVVFTYAKLLSEQIFVPITTENKSLMYSPFQCVAQYFLSKGYSGIVYSSTVFPEGKNVVLFDKSVAHPYGNIRKIEVPSGY